MPPSSRLINIMMNPSRIAEEAEV